MQVFLGASGMSSARASPRSHPARKSHFGIVFFLLLLPGGCSAGEPGPVSVDPVYLVSREEHLQLRAALLAELRQSVARSCQRPVLGGEPRAGRADDELTALAEPTGSLARCVQLVTRHRPALRRALFLEKPPASRPAQALPWARADPPAALRGTLGEVATACRTLPSRLAAAGRFGDACSPYLPGRRRLPDLVPILRLGLATVVLARERAASREEEAALRLLLDGMRFGQDLCRGGTPWIWPLVTGAALTDLVATAAELLATRPLGAATLERLDRWLTLLDQGEPPLVSYVSGELLFVELDSYLLPLLPAGQAPPGGWPLDWSRQRAAARRRFKGRSAAFLWSEQQGVLLGWLAHRGLAARLRRRCAPPRGVIDCFRALREKERRAAAVGPELQARLDQLVSGVASRFDRFAVREAAIALLADTARSRASVYLRRVAARPFYLMALRLHVAVLRHALAHGWPTVASVRSLAPARRDPVTGAPVVVERCRRGFLIYPAWREMQGAASAPAAPLRYLIARPPRRSPPGRAHRPRSPGARGGSGRGVIAAPRGRGPRTR